MGYTQLAGHTSRGTICVVIMGPDETASNRLQPVFEATADELAPNDESTG